MTRLAVAYGVLLALVGLAYLLASLTAWRGR